MTQKSRMEMQADAIGLTLEQYKEMKTFEIELDEYKKLINDKETYLTEKELAEFKESEMSFEEYMKKNKKSSSKKTSTKSKNKSIDELSNEEKIQKLLGLEIEEKKKIEKYNLYLDSKTMDKIITVAETSNNTIKDVINHILNKHLEPIDIDEDKVASFRARTTRKRRGKGSE